MEYIFQRPIDVLFDKSRDTFTLGKVQIPIYQLKSERKNEILSSVFAEEKQRQHFENKTLEEQISLVRLQEWYSLSMCKLKRSFSYYIVCASNDEMAKLFPKAERLQDVFLKSKIKGILMCGDLLLGIVWGTELLWLGATISCLESDIDVSLDNNGAGYSGGGDVTEDICTLVYLVDNNN